MAIDLFTINRILVLMIDIFAIWLGGWVFLSNPRQKLNRIFIGMTVFMLLWVNFAYLARVVGESNPFLVLLFLKIAWFATPLFFITLYVLALHILDENFKYKIINLAIISLAIITSFVAGFTDHIVKGIKFMGLFLIRLVYGDWMLLFLLVILLFIAATLQALFKKYYLSSETGKQKIGYYLLGIIIFYIANIIFNIVFPIVFDITRFYFLGDYSTIILLGLIAYALVKQNLFGIKIVLTALLVSFIAILLVFDIFVFTQPFILQFFKGINLLVFIYMGRELIKSVLKGEKMVEKMKKLNNDLVKANDSLKELLEMKTSFVHIVSHQLRTPLTAMRGYISMWQEGDFDSYPRRKMMEIKDRIANNAERLNNLVNEMVIVMESEGGMKLNFEKVDIEEIIKNNIELLNVNYEAKNLYLKYQKMEKSLPKIEADAKYLSNAFMNIIDNAEKYTQKGGLKITICKKDDNIRIKFVDTGVGIKTEDRKNLFHKFCRGAGSSLINPNGSGLGLYIIKQIITEHHGKIGFKSEGEGKGTAFTVELPVKQPISAESFSGGKAN